jgi:hypothetical protein
MLKEMSPTIVIGPGGVGDKVISQFTVLIFDVICAEELLIIFGVNVNTVLAALGIVIGCWNNEPRESLIVSPKLPPHRLLKILLDWNVVPLIE